jgi:hypothetical protein
VTSTMKNPVLRSANKAKALGMTSSFLRQLEPCFGNGPFVYRGSGANPDSLPLTPGAYSSGSAPDHIPRCPEEVPLLNRLLADEGSAESLRLRERLTKVDSQSQCLLRTLFWFGSLCLLSLIVLTYCATLLPEVLSYSLRFGIDSLIFLCLVGLIFEVELLGYLLWHRIVVNRLRQECRLKLSRSGAQLRAPQNEPSRQPPVGDVLFPPSAQKAL